MNKKIAALILVSISTTLVPSFAEDGSADKPAKPVKKTALEKNIDAAQLYFDQGKFLKAERSWIKVQTELQKGDPDERLANAWLKLGDTYSKESKFPLAEKAFKQSIEVLKGISKDPQEAQSKLVELDSVYKSINLKGFDETTSSFADHVGALDACALKKEDKHHIDINLSKRFQEKVTELASQFMPKKADGTQQEVPELPTGKDTPQVKSLRLDKKIAFDVHSTDDGLLKLSNIEGISFDVGLWAKLKEMVMLNTDPNSPAVEITAGAFGVEKKVKTDVPKNVFDRLKEGINKFDPFSAKNTISSASPTVDSPAVLPVNSAPAEGVNSTVNNGVSP